MEIEWLILADAAQVTGNKLYLLGGGWDRLTQSGAFPFKKQAGLALSIEVPWNQTNEQHSFEIQMATEDGEVGAQAIGAFEAGRPPGMPPGQSQRVQLAAMVIMEFKAPGTFVIVAKLDGEEKKRVHFNVIQATRSTPLPAG